MKLLTILGMIAVAFVGMLGSMTWVLIDVNDRSPDGMHVFVPAPLALADVAVRLVPAHVSKPLDVDIDPDLIPVIQAAVRELKQAGDFEMVRVEDGDELVVVRIEDGLVHVSVDDGSDRVRVRLPLRSIEAAIKSIEDLRVEPVELLAALDHLPSGRLVEVHDHEVDVTISVW